MNTCETKGIKVGFEAFSYPGPWKCTAAKTIDFCYSKRVFSSRTDMFQRLQRGDFVSSDTLTIGGIGTIA